MFKGLYYIVADMAIEQQIYSLFTHLASFGNLLFTIFLYGFAFVGFITIWRKFNSTRTFLGGLLISPLLIIIYLPWLLLIGNYAFTRAIGQELDETLSDHEALRTSLIAYSKTSKRLANQYRDRIHR